MNYKQLDDKYVMHTYNRFPLCIIQGKQNYVYDDQNKAYLDFTSGIGVNVLGHAHPQWVEAISEQARQLAHISNLYYTQPMLTTAQLLCEKSKMKKVFFANSGAEANEGAIKIARKYANTKYANQRQEIITLTNSFHGRTMTTLTATGQDSFHQHFDPFMKGFTYVQANNIEDLQNKVTEKTAAIMIEIVQGEGGVLPLNAEFVRIIQYLCKQKDILLIVDEVQTGIGRCGSFFAYEQMHLHPNIVTSAKALGNGLPIGAILVDEKCEDTLSYGDHGTTYGANPIACAGANVVLSYMNDDLYASVKEKGAYIKEKIKSMQHIKQVNGLGLMLGVELIDIDVNQLVLSCLQQGVLFLSAKQNLRLLPPLTITYEEIDHALAILETTLEKWEK